MNRSSCINLALLLTVAALGTLAYIGPSRRDALLSSALSPRSPAEARVIRIDRDDSPEVLIEKNGGIWRLAAPVSAEADAFQIQRLIAILAARPTQRFDAVRLDRFGLDPPRSLIRIDDESFAFGMVNAVSGEQYVLARDGVYTVAPHLGAAVPANAMQLVRKQLLSRSEVPMGFEMGGFSLRHQDEGWLLTPAQGSLSQDDLARWAENWRLAAASRVAPFVPREAPAEVRIALKSGAWITLGIMQREPELVIARHDEKLQYHFPSSAVRRLLGPPGVTHNSQAGNQ